MGFAEEKSEKKIFSAYFNLKNQGKKFTDGSFFKISGPGRL